MRGRIGGELHQPSSERRTGLGFLRVAADGVSALVEEVLFLVFFSLLPPAEKERLLKKKNNLSSWFDENKNQKCRSE